MRQMPNNISSDDIFPIFIAPLDIVLLGILLLDILLSHAGARPRSLFVFEFVQL